MTTPTDKTLTTYRSTWTQLDSVCYSDQEATNSCSWTQTKKAKDPGGFHLCIFNSDTMDFLLWYTWNLRPRGVSRQPKNSLNTPLLHDNNSDSILLSPLESSCLAICSLLHVSAYCHLFSVQSIQLRSYRVALVASAMSAVHRDHL